MIECYPSPKFCLRKIRKISPGAYIFQRPFLRGLFLEEPIFGGAYVRREICVSKSIGLACSGKEIYRFCFVLLCIQGQIPSTSPPGAYIRRGDLTEGFLRYDFGGLIFGGAYTWRGLFSEFYGTFLLRCKIIKPLKMGSYVNGFKLTHDISTQPVSAVLY